MCSMDQGMDVRGEGAAAVSVSLQSLLSLLFRSACDRLLVRLSRLSRPCPVT